MFMKVESFLALGEKRKIRFDDGIISHHNTTARCDDDIKQFEDYVHYITPLTYLECC